jgi:hypothetical protein
VYSRFCSLPYFWGQNLALLVSQLRKNPKSSITTESTSPQALPDSSPNRNMATNFLDGTFNAMILHPSSESPNDLDDDFEAAD